MGSLYDLRVYHPNSPPPIPSNLLMFADFQDYLQHVNQRADLVSSLRKL